MPTPLHRAARRITRRLGVHGAGLLWVALVWWLIGLRVLLAPARPPTGGILALIPDSVELVLWWSAALLCLNAAIDRDGPRRDAFALVTAVIAPTLAATSYLTAWVVNGNPTGWYAAVIYAALIGFVAIVAAIPDETGPRS